MITRTKGNGHVVNSGCPDPINSLKQTYDSLKEHLRRYNQNHRLVEPYTDVAKIEELRNKYRPKKVRLLILGESHRRGRPKRIPGFIYDENYNGQWWHELFWPVFGPKPPCPDTRVRRRCLEALRDSEVWVLDASIIALSGYDKLDGKPPSRPFDSERLTILESSWHGHVKRLVVEALTQPQPPVIVCFNSVRHLIPCREQRDIYRLDFPRRGQKYNPIPLQKAARKVDLLGCLRDIVPVPGSARDN